MLHRQRSHSVSDRPGGINYPHSLGEMGGLRKSEMHSDSRKAQRNSFAYHRAALLFSSHLIEKGEGGAWSASLHEGKEPFDLKQLKRRVSAGILGFAPATAVATS
jgi:hypothetical protein